MILQSPAISQLYLDWGVTNSDVKTKIAHFLHPERREKLWVHLHGKVSVAASRSFVDSAWSSRWPNQCMHVELCCKGCCIVWLVLLRLRLIYEPPALACLLPPTLDLT